MSALIAGIPSWVIPMIEVMVSILALTIILERGWMLLRRIEMIDTDEERKLLELIRDKSHEEAESFCRMKNHPAYKVALAMIQARESKIDISNIAEEENMRQMSFLEKYLPTLGTISTIAPLLGLLGTVTGMIKAFKAYETTMIKSGQLFGGIDEALITTAIGLIIAIPALIMYNYYVARVNMFAQETEILIQMVTQELKKKK